jgi:hypothetical protein
MDPRVTVRDTGPGIRAEELPRLFEPYAKLSNKPTAAKRARASDCRSCGRLWICMAATCLPIVSREAAPRFISNCRCIAGIPPLAGERVRQITVVNL